MSVSSAQTIDLRGAALNLLLYEGDTLPVVFEIDADLTGATVEMRFYYGAATPLTLSDTGGLTITTDTGFDADYAQVVKDGYSLVELRNFTSQEWAAFTAATRKIEYELRYELGSTIDTPYRGALEITRRPA